MSSAADIFHEGITIRTAYTDLVAHVCLAGVDPDAVLLRDVRSGLADFGVDRFGAFLFAHKHVDSFEAGLDLAREVEVRWLRAGRRPRSLRELLPGDAVEQAFAQVRELEAEVERAERPSWWWRGLVRVGVIADAEAGARLARADRDQRVREGKQP